ncbi:type II secretion system protein [Candidatus Microgenomates bacterium]|nr:type II secretion system protein [Candidatus Microgenomates bacterium]MBI2622202.1 type II secretion system protein [Candidatus Microgenomates bacterium]
MKRIHQTLSQGFTLIELLVVITILGILVTLALVTINPAEAQKKGRDTQRLKDVATIQSIVEQLLADNPGAITTAAANSGTPATGANSCTNTGWLSQAFTIGGVKPDLCKYANVIPIDPSNRSTSVTTRTGTVDATARKAMYSIVFTGGTTAYKICTKLESTANGAKLINDGEAAANDFFAVFSSDTATCVEIP